MTVAARLLAAIRNSPGRTESELAHALFGDHASQARVNFPCRLLEIRQCVERRGLGGPGDPYRYYPGERVLQDDVSTPQTGQSKSRTVSPTTAPSASKRRSAIRPRPSSPMATTVPQRAP